MAEDTSCFSTEVGPRTLSIGARVQEAPIWQAGWKGCSGGTRSEAEMGPAGIKDSRSDGERGAVAVVVALLMVVLLGFVGLGVDIGYWFFQGWRQQQAADQAALAGAVFLPGDPTQAQAVARQFAELNGYSLDVVTTAGTGKNSSKLSVSLSRNYNGFFSKVLGKKFQNIYRTGTAEFVAPVAIGSPFARAGNDPENAIGGNFNYWLNQHGPWVAKHNGDRYAADICDADPTVVHKTPYGCIPSTQTRGNNVDYARIGKFGYRYSVDVSAVQAGKDLVFEVFDGVTTDVGSGCTNGLPTPTQRQALSQWVPDADVRYRVGNEPNGLNWCAADNINLSGTAARNTQYMDTEFAVFAPSRSVATGALVQNTTPPTTIPPVITTTTAPGGGATVAGPCSPVTTAGATTITVVNDRATSLKGYLVNPACVETLVFTNLPASSVAVNSYAGYRYRFYDASSGAFVSEYTVPTPTSSSGGYARRSLESPTQPRKFVSLGASVATVESPSVIALPLAASFEITPAANGQAGCVSFKSAEAIPRYLSFASPAAPVVIVNSVAGLAAGPASWCPQLGSSVYATHFASAASPTEYLYLSLAGEVSAGPIATPLDPAFDWLIGLPMAPRLNEPLPLNTKVALEYPYNSACVTAAPVADSPVLLDACLPGLNQQFELKAGSGSNVKIMHQSGVNFVRPDNSGTAVDTPAQIEPLRNDPSDEWIPTVLSNGLVTFRSAVNQGYLFDSAACSIALPIPLRVSPSPLNACQQMYMHILPAPIVAPIPYVGSTASVSLVAHLESPGPCAGGSGTATFSVTNQRPVSVGVYSVGANCRESFLDDVAAGGSQSFLGLRVGQTVRFYETSSNRLASSYTIQSANSSHAVTTTGPATTCSPSSGVAATINVVNQRPDPIRVFSVDTLCNETAEQTVVNGWTATTYAGSIWRVVDTYSGATLRTFTAIAGAQSITELPSVLTSGNCSTASGANATLQVVNERSTALTLKRVGTDCIELLEGTATPTSTTLVNSHVGERWKIFDGAIQVGDITLASTSESLTIAAPNLWVWDPNAGAVTSSGTVLLCSRVETAYPLTSYSSNDQHTGTVSQLLNPVDGVHDNGSGTRDTFSESFATGFRRWRQFCKIPAASVVAGRYTITTKTNLNDQSAGSNSFSLRAQWRGAAPADTSEAGLQLSAMENFPVFMNFGAASTSTLFMTRLSPVHAGRTMRLELFDIGDTSGTLDFQVLPPLNSNVGATWPCSMKLVSQDGVFPPTGLNAATCAITGLSRQNYNGAALQIDIPIPATFDCPLVLATDCWTSVKLTFNNGTPTDRTTWSASVLGDPLRLLR